MVTKNSTPLLFLPKTEKIVINKNIVSPTITAGMYHLLTMKLIKRAYKFCFDDLVLSDVDFKELVVADVAIHPMKNNTAPTIAMPFTSCITPIKIIAIDKSTNNKRTISLELFLNLSDMFSKVRVNLPATPPITGR